MFAKLFNTSKGQCLIQKFDGQDDSKYTYDLNVTLDVESPIPGATAVVTKRRCFAGTDEGEAARDAVFDDFDEIDAERLAGEPL